PWKTCASTGCTAACCKPSGSFPTRPSQPGARQRGGEPAGGRWPGAAAGPVRPWPGAALPTGPYRARGTTRPPVIRTSSSGVMRNTAWGVPAAANSSSYFNRSSSIKVGMGVAWATGGTPPMANPVASRTVRASARSTGAPNKAPSLSVSAWLAPDTKARTGWPPATNTRLLTIWATLVPMASAASWAVRVLWANSTISVSTPFSRSTARTRSLAAAADIGATSLNAGKYSSKAFLFPFAAGRGHPVAPARAKPAPRGQDRARPLWKSTPRAIRTPSTPAAIRGGEVNTTVNRFPLPKHREEDEAALRERALRRRAEERILEAMAQGAFDNLPGKGRPLDLRENPFVPPE